MACVDDAKAKAKATAINLIIVSLPFEVLGFSVRLWLGQQFLICRDGPRVYSGR
jgi:hypothetical protein